MSSFKRKLIASITRSFSSGYDQSVADFRNQMASVGINPPEEVVPDGTIHRFSSNGKKGDTSGWYVLYSEPVLAGAFGCWRSQISEKWCSTTSAELSADDQRKLTKQFELAKVARDKDLKNQQALAAQKAQNKWANARLVDTHPYLQRKGISSHGLRISDGDLLVPILNIDGALTSLQSIDAVGKKRFMSGGQVAGCFYTFGVPAGEIVICEGFATGATIFEQVGGCVVVAFSAGNVLAVADVVKKKYPHSQIVIAADNDLETAGNPGVTQAKVAAAAVGARIAIPRAHGGENVSTDMNDVYLLQGASAVAKCINEAAHVSPTGEIWQKPRPVMPTRPSVEPLHPELIPTELRGWINDISLRMGCKADFPAVASLVALSSLIGARAVVAPKALDNWKVVPVLWGQIIAPPGSQKSPALSETMRPLQVLDTEDRKSWLKAHADWESDQKLQKMAVESNEKQAKSLAATDPEKARSLLSPVPISDSEPKLRRRVLNDTTVEKLAEVLVDHPHGILVYRDELHGLLSQMDRAGQEGARSFYLQGFDGNQPYTVDRIGRGTLHIPRVCIAMLGGIQPGLLDDYVKGCVQGGVGNDGLLQRFGLSVWPDHDEQYQYVDQKPDEEAEKRAYEVFKQLDMLAPADDGEPIVWRYSAAAQTIFQQWLTELEVELRGDELSPAMKSHLSKYRKLIPALSLIFALIDTPTSKQVVGERELERAISWGVYLRSHAQRMYSAQPTQDGQRAADLLQKLRDFWVVESSAQQVDFTPREIALKGWAGLGTSADVRKAAMVLVDHGWLRKVVLSSSDEKGRGRPSERYQIHPDLKNT